jgi:hypothetical protein
LKLKVFGQSRRLANLPVDLRQGAGVPHPPDLVVGEKGSIRELGGLGFQIGV